MVTTSTATQKSTARFDHEFYSEDILAKIKQQQSGYLAMDDAFLSIAARIFIIRQAKYCLDLQYYIWSNDYIGNLIFHELLQAADRGVHIRILIDDQNGRQLDAHFQALKQHPKFEIKLYNPYKFRVFRFIDYIYRAAKINRRMHNKLIIADGSIAVTGGRNISSEYFEASESFQFTDMDILFLGAAVEQANQVFIDFWQHKLSMPVENLIKIPSLADILAKFRIGLKIYDEQQVQIDKKIEKNRKYIEETLFQQHKLKWVKAHFLADSPEKTLANAYGDQLIVHQIRQYMGVPKHRFAVVSAYFVPTLYGAHYLAQLAQHQIQTRVLTNSLLANDVVLVHAYYQKYRKQLLQSGVKLYEFKPYILRKRRSWYEVVTGNVIPAKGKNKSSLHAKFLSVDDKAFIGSFNFDPRSAHLNTEVGLFIESKDLSLHMQGILDASLTKVAYALVLDDKENIIWRDDQGNGQVVEYKHDPQSSRFERLMMYSIAYLPLEWLM
ncbi:phospholipase D family protein [Acinetobacter larvae]|uniref:Phospholipase n=1 Tax=Acinetobacter larvae TaxID=1789224 RepID=A0A1B2LZT3_9GAMM|nr:phospholipase [Acinetobacter larvae]